MTLPEASVFMMLEARVDMVRPADDSLSPLIVDVAVPPVVSIAVADIPAEKVDDALVPCTTRKPVVVAPPKMVSPPA